MICSEWNELTKQKLSRSEFRILMKEKGAKRIFSFEEFKELPFDTKVYVFSERYRESNDTTSVIIMPFIKNEEQYKEPSGRSLPDASRLFDEGQEFWFLP